jgi:hypothetical protein
MKPSHFILAFLLFVCSCTDTRSEKELGAVKKDLQASFGHQNIRTSLQRGTGKEHLSVTFVDYDLTSQPDSRISEMALRVRNHLLSRHPDYEGLDTIEVRFTERNVMKPSQIRAFRYAN